MNLKNPAKIQSFNLVREEADDYRFERPFAETSKAIALIPFCSRPFSRLEPVSQKSGDVYNGALEITELKP